MAALVPAVRSGADRSAAVALGSGYSYLLDVGLWF